MDNDHEVVPAHENKVQLFLRENLLAIRKDEQQTYDLDEEFGKTSKNRDFFVVTIVVVVVALIATGSWFITSRINESSRNVAVDITVFEDINLKNVLDLAKKAEASLEQAQEDKISAQASYRSEISNLQVQRKSELDILDAMRMSETERVKQKQTITASYARRELSLKTAYTAKMTAIDSRLAEAKKQVESFDTKRVEEARAQKKLMDSQQDVYELEKKQLKDSYEKEISTLRTRNEEILKENAKLKTDQVKELIDEYQARISALDPILDDELATSYMSQADLYDAPGKPFRALPDKIPSDFNFSKSDFQQIAMAYDGLDLLLSKISSIPFENNVDDWVNAAHRMAFLAGSAEENVIRSAFSRIDLDRQDLADALSRQKDVETALSAELANRKQVETLLAETKANADAAQQSVATYEKSLSDAAIANEYDGYILTIPANLEASDGSIGAPSVFLLPGVTDTVFANETPVLYVYRAPKTLVATLLLSKTDTGYSVTVEKVDRKKDFLPMNYILVKKR